jgi:hypothetical protein
MLAEEHGVADRVETIVRVRSTCNSIAGSTSS